MSGWFVCGGEKKGGVYDWINSLRQRRKFQNGPWLKKSHGNWERLCVCVCVCVTVCVCVCVIVCFVLISRICSRNNNDKYNINNKKKVLEIPIKENEGAVIIEPGVYWILTVYDKSAELSYQGKP